MATAAITVDLNARIAGFETDLKKATATLDNFGARGNAVAGVMKSAFAGLGAVVSVGALASFAKSGIDAADALNDMSMRLKVSVKDLASFKLIAEQSGTSLEGVGKGIARLTRSIGEAESGNKQLASALATLGVTARDPKEAFYQLADAVQKIHDPAQRAALLNQVLGKSYQELIPLLEGGGQSLRESAKASESFSVAMAKLAPDADKFNDQLAQIQTNAAGAAASILSKMLPSLNSLIDRFKAGITAAGGFWAAAAKGLKFSFDTPGEGLEKLGKRFSVLHQQLNIAREKGDTSTAASLESERTEILQEMKYLNAIKAASLPSVPDTAIPSVALSGGGGGGTSARAKPKGGGVSGGVKSDPLASLLASTDIGKMEEFDKKVALLNTRFDDGRKNTELYAQAMTKLIETVFSANFSDFDKQQQDAIASAKEFAAVQVEFERATAIAAKAAEQDAAAIATQVVAQRAHNEEIGLSVEAMAELTQARLDTAIATAQQLEIERTLAGASNEELAAIWDKIAALTELKKLQGEGAAKQGNFDALKDIDAYLNPAKAKSFGDALSNSFGKAGTAIGKMAGAFDNYAQKQAEFNKKRAALSPEDLIKKETALTKKQAEIQINAYADMAGAAKSFFEEGTTGYKVMAAAEQGFRALQMALSIAAMVQGTTETTKEVAENGIKATANTMNGVAKAFSQMGVWGFVGAAAIIAFMASMGGKGGGGGGSAPSINMSEQRQKKQGTGTVLGDPDAKSESLSNSLEMLADVNVLTMKYSAMMANSLKNIEIALGGVSSLIFRNGGLTSGNLSGVLEQQSKKGKTEVTDSGLTYKGKIGDIGTGLQTYTDVTTREKRKKEWNSVTKTFIKDASDDISNQFQMIFDDIGNSLVAAGGVFGRSADILETQIANIEIDLGMVSLKGLKGEDLQEALNGVIGAAADDIAQKVLPGLEKYIKVGEGYYETAIRVAYSTEVVQASLKMIDKGFSGAAMEIVEFSQTLINAFGDLETLTDAIGEYYDRYFSDQEKFADSVVALRDGFANLGYAIPKTKDEFRAIVGALDLTTAAGAEMFASLMAISPAFLDVADAIAGALLDINSMFGDSIQSIQLSVLSPEEQYNFWRTKLDADLAALALATDPAMIAKYAEAVNSSTNAAYGLLDEGQQKALAPEFIAYLEKADTLATDRLNASQDNIIAIHQGAADAMEAAMMRVAEKMLEAAQTPLVVAVDVTGNVGATVEVGP